MPDIDLDFMCHKLSILPQENPMAKRKCKFNEERCQSVDQEVGKLLKVDFIREIVYHHMVVECGDGKEVQWVVEDMYRRCIFRQSLPKSHISFTKY